MAAQAKKARAVEFEGTEHTEASLNEMTTSAVCQLVMRMRGETMPPKPATKAKAIDLVWRAAENLPAGPEPAEPEKITQAIPEAPPMPDAEPIPLDATADVRGAEKKPSAKARKAKTYSVRIDGAERAAKVDPYTLAHLAGHSDFAMTKRYVHPQKETIRKAMEKARGWHANKTDQDDSAAN